MICNNGQWIVEQTNASSCGGSDPSPEPTPDITTWLEKYKWVVIGGAAAIIVLVVVLSVRR